MGRMLVDVESGDTTAYLLGTGEGEKEVVRLIDFTVSEVASDGMDILPTGDYLQGNLSAMVRGHEVKNRTLLRNPNDWIMELAQEVADGVDDHVRYFFEGGGDDEVSEVTLHNVDTSAFTPKVLHSAIACHVMGEASHWLNQSWSDFENASYFFPLDNLECFYESEITSLVVTATEQCMKQLEAARWCAGYCTSFAALHKCLSPYECP